MVEMFLRLGANLETQESIYEGPLYRAALAGHEDMVSLLLDRGANPDLGRHESPLEAWITPWQAAKSSGPH